MNRESVTEILKFLSKEPRRKKVARRVCVGKLDDDDDLLQRLPLLLFMFVREEEGGRGEAREDMRRLDNI